ncbi:heme-binding protein [Octadecabacter sp. 1_MG-2023]|uniref:GlcG/HbpS family heme-binding protein n=1 Tax=unclassified Octadecabacter TaxID=196158 RepID=UPI001C0901C5|nr:MULTISPECIES: heme-binding protein [unclassified Octadecabacter]MBU2992966.1 heme-binding protein [Octadecabacter sp. B2R22]MDO6733582.1 heme-binding protein [Octadecabacter sp. 1_MG-2023]
MADISTNKARTIIRKGLIKAREMELRPMGIVVVDAGGHVIAFEREDDAPPGRFTIAQGKAYGAVMLRMAGTAQMARAEAQAYFMAAANGAFGGKMIPLPGGVLVLDKRGKVVGAVGVTGDTSDNDAICAVFGIEAANLSAEI